MTTSRTLSLIALVAPCLLAAMPASADDGVETRERAARTACLSGDYGKGVALLSELFVDRRNPTYIFNQGRCFEQNRRYEDAIARFNEYLLVGKNLSAEERADADARIAACKEAAASQVRPSDNATLAASPSPATLPAMLDHQAAAPRADAGSRLRTAGVITAAVGGAAILGGLLLNLKANALADDLEQPNGYTDGKSSDRKTYVALGWTGYGVGAACVATGAVLYVLGRRADDSASVRVVPTLAAGHMGAVLKGAF